MCLAIPGKIIKIKGDEATIEYGEIIRQAKLIEKKYKINDYVIVQARVVMQKIPKKQALETLKMIEKEG